MPREVTHRYEDALDRVWLSTAQRIGLRVVRSDEVYASTDGRGTLTIGAPSTLDADDSLAQMIFHELCHSVVQGPESLEQPDWGLDNESERDRSREHACLRVQAHLASRHGLRAFFAPTTEHRAFYDRLRDPFAGDDESIVLARIGAVRSRRPPWAPHLEEALSATAAIVKAASAYADATSLYARFEAPERHPSGLGVGARGTCGECAWRRRRSSMCLQSGKRVDPSWAGCDRFEAELECRACAACCREAYGVVEIGKRDPFVKRHPDLVQRVDGRLVLSRVEGRCPALEGEGPYACRVYEDRPRTCRDFEAHSANCLEARRRVGLSL